ncbi:XylR N-terminal domain-containing protein [Dehalobacter sp. 14DCB1]|uniref:XylR N-terminal domain-containing protein n=1 Tax=Dehalobacter sp. 14DCB1 TaxID=2070227 RepID=UPI001052E332|nr:XylR N-terminal domain-containing protein [Dehalobacter sp. 14DCB1]TCX51684.1 hypothetical protein C1I36_04960 [Dehalobacter sp. 14DCB1]
MKANNLKMSEILDFSTEQGKIFIKGTRVLIKNADAMGTLRKDLISTLGFERAKGFLIRYGWACGFNDALALKGKFDWENDYEWIMSGPVLHGLEGVGRIDIQTIRVSPEERNWLIKARFINSFEAEQHLRFFGTHDRPVCWTLIGYASGYASACFFPERVYYKEIKCIGKGDPYCECVGKTLDEWGDEISSELPYYEEQKINEELEAANIRIQQQHLHLQKILDIQEQLTNTVLNGQGLEGITKTLADIINGYILVFDNKIQTLVSSDFHKMPGEILKKMIEEFFWELMRCPSKKKKSDTLMIKKEPLWTTFKIENQNYDVVFVPIVVRYETIGLIVAVQLDGAINEFILDIQHVANAYALELIKQKTIVDLEQQYRGEFLESLFSENISSKENVKAWAFRLGHDISERHIVVVMRADSVLKKEINSEIFELIYNFLNFSYPSVLCGQLKDKVIFLLPNRKFEGRKNIEDFIICLKQKLGTYSNKICIFIGVGQATSEFSDYSRSYHQAVRALEIGRMFEKDNEAIFYDELGSLALLFESNNKQELLDFMERTLAPLIKYDAKFNGELIKTLGQYLNNENIQKTSKEYALSVSGLKYRLNKIKDLGYDLKSQQRRFDLRLALSIYKMKQMF